MSARWLTRREGPGPVVAVVHGMEDSWQSWGPLVGALEPAWRAVALDLPWRAGNDYQWRRTGRPGRYLAEALAAIGPVDGVIAHSFGANAVLEAMADGLLDGFAGAVLAAPFYRPPDLPVTWTLFEQSRAHFERHMREGLRVRLGERAERLDPDVLGAMVAKTVDRIGPAGFLAVFDQFTSTPSLDLSTVKIPTLVLAGVGDPSLSRRRADALAAAMPLARIVVQEGYDHFCHVRQAADMAHRTTKFLRTAWDAPPARARKECTA
jgi:pimeloyl-ACP methyl ester carboxylesterase